MDQGHEIIHLDPPLPTPLLLERGLRRVLRWVRVRFDPNRNRHVLRRMARNLARALGGVSYDAVFSMSSLFVVELRTAVPIVSWDDAVYECVVGLYDDYKNLDFFSRWAGHRADARALRKCDRSVLTSVWAAKVAARRYRFPLDRLRVIAHPANLPDLPTSEDVAGIRRRASTGLTCLLVGVDWHRKGGDIAWEAVSALRQQGLDISLVCVGMAVPAELRERGGMRAPGLLRKDRPDEWSILRRLFLEADVLLLPSRADFTPNVILEAYAFGLPVIASDVGAIPELVQHGVTGFVVRQPASAADYTRYLRRLLESHELRASFSEECRRWFEAEFTPRVVARKLTAMLNEAVECRPRSR